MNINLPNPSQKSVLNHPKNTGYWPRWWDQAGNCLPWSNEQAAIEAARDDAAEAQIKAAEAQIKAAEAKADRLAAILRAQGIDPDAI